MHILNKEVSNKNCSSLVRKEQMLNNSMQKQGSCPLESDRDLTIPKLLHVIPIKNIPYETTGAVFQIRGIKLNSLQSFQIHNLDSLHFA